MNINYKKIEEIFGLDFLNIKSFAGSTTRDNHLFSLIKKIVDNDYEYIRIQKNADKFQMVFYKNDESEEGNIVKWSSIGSHMHDIALLDPSLRDMLFIKMKSKASGDEMINWGKINLSVAKKNFVILQNYSNNNWNNINSIFSYWKSLSHLKIKDDFINKIYLSIYLIFSGIGVYKNIEIEKLIKTNKIKILTNLLRPFVIKMFIEEEKEKRAEARNEIKNFSNEKKLAFTKTIGEMIHSIRDGEITVPVFQRNYIWKPKQICLLLNSILSNIPIGSILLAKTNKKFGEKNEIIKSIKISNTQEDHLMIIDGQQRITSIVMAMETNKILMKLGCSTKNIDEMKNIEKISKDIYFNSRKKIFSLRTKIDKKDLLCEEWKKISDVGGEIYELIKNKELSIIKIDGYNSGKLIDVFEKINVGSTKLSTIDLMHAAFTTYNENYNFLEELERIKNSSKIKEFELKHEQIVNMWKIIFDYEANNKYSYKNSNLLDLALEKEMSNKWVSLTSKVPAIITKVIEKMEKRFGFYNKISLPNDAFLMIATLVILNKNIDEDASFGRIIKRTINKDYSAGTFSKIISDLNCLSNGIYSSSTITQKKFDMFFDEMNCRKKNGFYKLIIGHLSLQKPLSLINGSTPVISMNGRWETPDKDQHHFVPSKNHDFKTFTDNIKNKISNIMLISSKENRDVIKNKNPFDYLLQDVDTITDQMIEKVATSHFLDKKILFKVAINKDKNEEMIMELIKNRGEKIKKDFINKWRFINK